MTSTAEARTPASGHILVVEDDREMARFLDQLLSEERIASRAVGDEVVEGRGCLAAQHVPHEALERRRIEWHHLDHARARGTDPGGSRIAARDVPRLTKFVLALPIAMDPVARRRPLGPVHRLARSHGLSAYDGAYLELAIRHGIPIATLDADLRAAARAEGVGVFAEGG